MVKMKRIDERGEFIGVASDQEPESHELTVSW